MRMIFSCRSRLAALACTAIFLCLPLVAIAQVIDEYTLDEQKARQAQPLEDCRADLDVSFELNRKNEFGVFTQAVALLCELTHLERLEQPPVDPSAAELQAHWIALVERLDYLLDNEANEVVCPTEPVTCPAHLPTSSQCDAMAYNACCAWLDQPCKDVSNAVNARKSAFLLAYVMRHHFATLLSVPIDPQALDSFAALARHPELSEKLVVGASPGNSDIPLYGLRILAGEILFDPHLLNRGVGEFYAQYDQVGRRNFAEPNAPHYAGVTISLLSLLRDTANAQLKADVDQLLAAHFLIPAHPYLPGGGLGAVQDRDKSGGGIADPDPTEASHLIPAINMFVNDPDLPIDTGHEKFALTSDYEVPEIIRSIYLDKGAETSRFWFRRDAAFDSKNGWYPGFRDYLSNGWEGKMGRAAWEIRTSPWEAVVLPGGRAEMGIGYGEEGGHDATSGLYLRRPGSGAPSFSILYHRLPRPDENYPTEEPDPDDNLWDRERSSAYRRMLWGNTAVTLWDLNDQTIPPNAETGEIEVLHTEVHLPDFCDPTVADGCHVFPADTGNNWYVGKSGNAYVAFLPLGDLAASGGVDDKGDWIYLKLDSTISGNITVLADAADFNNFAAFKNHIKDRFVSFTADPPEVTIDVSDGGGTTRMRLRHGTPEVRAITVDPGNPASEEDVLDDEDYFPAEVLDSPWASWDETGGSFQLTVDREAYNAAYNNGDPLVYDYGSTTKPTTPINAELISRQSNGDVTLGWSHSWDDLEIEKYKIYYHDSWNTPAGGTLIAEVTDPGDWSTQNPTSPIEATVQGPADDGSGLCERKIQFSIEAWDASDPSPHRAFATDVPVEGDSGAPPTLPKNVQSRPANTRVVLTWDEASDDCGIGGYQVSRDLGPWVFVSASPYVDTNVVAAQEYDYRIRSQDLAGHWSLNHVDVEDVVLCGSASPPDPVPSVAGGLDPYGQSVTLTWDKGTDACAVLWYNVSRNGAPPIFVSAKEFEYADEITFVDTAIAPDNTYTYQISTVDFDGQVSAPTLSAPIVVPADTDAPEPPSTLTATPSAGQIDLSWDSGYDYWGVTGYEVIRDGPGGQDLIDVELGLSYADTDVSPGLVYDYTIRVTDSNGLTALSATESATAAMEE